MPQCPHSQAQFCPLYIAGHVAGLPTCMGDWDFDGCDVDNEKAHYEELVADLFRAEPSIVSEAAVAEEEFERRAQRERNMRGAGLH